MLLIQIDTSTEIGDRCRRSASIVATPRELGEHKFGDIAQALRDFARGVQQGWDW